VWEMKIKLWRFVIDVEKTEEWLNRLAAEGLHCVGFGFIAYRYYFEQGEAGAYTYRIAMLEESIGHPKSIQYIAFLKENGVECIGHVLGHVFLRKRTADGAFTLFTDRASQINNYRNMLKERKIGIMVLLVSALFYLYALIAGNINMAAGIGFISSHFHPIVIMFYACGLLLVGTVYSYIRQWRRYSARIKELQQEGALYE